jgi:hypothetical protein
MAATSSIGRKRKKAWLDSWGLWQYWHGKMKTLKVSGDARRIMGKEPECKELYM